MGPAEGDLQERARLANALTVRWAVAKWVPDLRRNEPINIGVIVWVKDQAIARFRWEGDDGHVDGRRIGPLCGHRPEARMYQQWVRHWHRAVERDRPLEYLTRRRGGDAYFVEPSGGHMNDIDTAAHRTLLDRLYHDLVEDTGAATKPDHKPFRTQVQDLLREADLLGDPNFHAKYPLRLKNSVEREFPYAWVNGHRTVGLLLGDPNANAVDAALLRALQMPPGVGTVVITGPPTDDEGLEQLERHVGHVAPLGDVTGLDVREMFLEDPRPRTRALL